MATYDFVTECQRYSEIYHREVNSELIVAAYTEGVHAVVRIASTFAENDWTKPTPCEGWSGSDLAAHLHATAARYIDLLERAILGHPARMVIGEELARMNAGMNEALAMSDPTDHVQQFHSLARSYLGRAQLAWNVRPYTFGWDASVGEAVAAQAIEWHVHAWDLARTISTDYRPKAIETLAEAWRVSMEPVFSAGIPLGDAWDGLLALYGRDPART